MEKRRKEDRPMEKAREMSQFTSAKTDPQGSWTGCPADPSRSLYFFRDSTHLPYFATLAAASAASAPWARM